MHFTKVLGLALALVCASSVAYAGGGFTISLNCNPDGSASVNLDSSGELQGWSLGVCHDSAAIGLTSVEDGAATAVVGGGGGPPAFDTITTFPDGWTVGVVIDFLGCCTLAPGSHELNVMQYDISGLDALASGDVPGTSDICFCTNTLGSPAVSIVVVESGASIPPAGIDSCCTMTGAEFVDGPADWAYSGSDHDVSGAPAAAWSQTMSFSITDNDTGTADTQGFSMGMSAAGGTDLAVSDPAPAGDLAGINGGTGPSFFGTSNFGTDWTVGVVYNFLGGVFLQYPAGSPAAVTADYSGTIVDGDVVTVSMDNTLGSPPVSNVVVVGGASFAAGQEPGDEGVITVSEITVTLFIRGDCNDDGIVNIADPVWTLNELFLSGPTSVCPAACDSNSDGMVDATDASYTLNYRFMDGPPPAAPFPDCGPDGGVDCASSCP